MGGRLQTPALPPAARADPPDPAPSPAHPAASAEHRCHDDSSLCGSDHHAAASKADRAPARRGRGLGGGEGRALDAEQRACRSKSGDLGGVAWGVPSHNNKVWAPRLTSAERQGIDRSGQKTLGVVIADSGDVAWEAGLDEGDSPGPDLGQKREGPESPRRLRPALALARAWTAWLGQRAVCLVSHEP